MVTTRSRSQEYPKETDASVVMGELAQQKGVGGPGGNILDTLPGV